jgi:hypothetical protein
VDGTATVGTATLNAVLRNVSIHRGHAYWRIMPEVLDFHVRDLYRPGDELGEPLDPTHLHARLRLQLDDTVVEYPEDVCLNDWMAALLTLQQEISSLGHSHVPITFFIDGLPGWPLFEVIRMDDLARAALIQGDEAVASCLLSTADFQVAVDRFLHSIFEEARRLGTGGADPLPTQLVRPYCDQFWTGKAGGGLAPGFENELDQPARVICIRAEQMTGDPVAGSARARCSQCQAEVLVAPSFQATVAQGAQVWCQICMLCERLAPSADLKREQEIAELKAKAERAYEEMYELHDDQEIAWRAELAEGALLSAARMEREAGLVAHAEATEKRARHIRAVHRHQFMQPPDRLA